MARYALVIGITSNDQSLGTLEKSAADAGAITQVLRDHGDFQVELLVKPEETTCEALALKLKEFLTVRALRHEALIYYTGHGFPWVDAFGEVEAFLAPSDCVVSWDGQGRAVRQQNGLSLNSVSRLAARAELSNLVMLLDCCHSGYVLEEGVLRQTFGAFVQKDYWLMTACRSFEAAYAKRGERYSIFTGAVLAGLGRELADERGVITVGELFASVAKALRGERQEVMQLSVGRPIELVRFRSEVVVKGRVDGENPYQGLMAFTKETRRFFFGRDAVVQDLVRALQGSSFVPLIGASGSGKSSVVRAGLVPRLEELGWKVLEPMKPGTEPLDALRSLTFQLDPISSQPTLLVVDQFEEVFTLSRSSEDQAAFIRELFLLSEKVAIVVTMRADFVEACLGNEGLTQAIRSDAVWLGPLTGVDLEMAIEQPAIVQGATIQPKLLAQILQDVEEEENCLPLLEFALSELWNRPLASNSGGTEPNLEVGRELTLADYRKLGGVTGALNGHAEGVYKQLVVQGREHWVQRVMLRLVRTGEGTKDTRQRQRRGDLLDMGKDAGEREAIEAVISVLVDGRLVVSDRDGMIDLSHEALMRSWGRLAGWREGDREVRRIVDRIVDARREWADKGKRRRDLLEGRLLKDGRRLLKDAPADVVGVKGFIWKSFWWRRSELAGLLVIPILVVGIPIEYFLRELTAKRDYEIIESLQGEQGERSAVLNLTSGCWAKSRYPEIYNYFRDRLFGNCRSLENAKLERANLMNVNLENVNLEGANLEGVNLKGANLKNSILKHAKMNRATLERTDMSYAELYSANLSESYLLDANLGHADLIGVNFTSANLMNVNLVQANLGNVNFNKTQLFGANLTNAFLGETNLTDANLWSTNLSDTILQGVNFSNAHFDDTNLQNATFRCVLKFSCPNLKSIRLSGTNNWQGIQGWETVENIPPALKQQLGLKDKKEERR